MKGVARTVNALERKYVEVKGDLDILKQHGKGDSEEGLKLAHNLDCLRVSIRLFDPGWTLRKATKPRSEFNTFGQRRGVLGGTALRVVGDATSPMTTEDVAIAVSELVGITKLQDVDRLGSYFSNFLREMEEKGYLKADESGERIRWSVTQADFLAPSVEEPVKPRPKPPRPKRRP